MNPDAVLGELEGLRALARSLVHGDADADDLLQETAIAAIAHPPDDDRPVRPWLATVLKNRWRMDRRGRARRQAREQALSLDDAQANADEVLDRARTLERLATALVALEEPFRTVVMRRYLDGESAAEIARALGVPAGTVRWRLKTGLERLRAALDESTPKWQRAFLPFAAKGAVLVKAKTTAISLVLLVLLLVSGVVVWFTRGHRQDPARPVAGGSAAAPVAIAHGSAMATGSGDVVLPLADPLPGQGRAVIAPVPALGGQLQGRVINWSTGDGVANAELTFTNDAGATTVRTKEDGAFDLSPAQPGAYVLAAVVAQGFLPFAPELTHSSVRAELIAHQAVRGVTVFLFPALPYFGKVVDAQGAEVAGAKVRLVGSPAGEQAIEKVATEWTTDAHGAFTFNAPDDAVFEAVKGTKRGWARVTGDVATTKNMTIKLGDVPARDGTITGRAVDTSGAPVAEVLVRAVPVGPPNEDQTRSPAFVLTGPDGAFVLDGLDKREYALLAEADDFAPAEKRPVPSGARDVVLTLDGGKPITGRVETTDGEPVPAYTLLVLRREGLVHEALVERSIVNPRGTFSVRVPAGDYELLASASGWAPSAPVPAAAGTKDVKIVLGAGATLRGKVIDIDTGAPLEYARVMREGAGGGASAQPVNAGTVTRADGTFELTGIPAGPLSISIGAGDYNLRFEAGLTAVDGAVLGPIQIGLKKLVPGEKPKIDLVGIGVKLAADKDALRVEEVVPNSGAADAGIVAGDRITAIDGVAVTKVGIEGAVSRIRGVAGTTIGISLLRGETAMTFVVTRKPLRF